MNKILTLNINGEAFAGLRTDFDILLRRTIANMQEKGSDAASMTIKLDITLTDTEVPDAESPCAKRIVQQPLIEYKVKSIMQIKDERADFVGGDYELAFDGKDFVMRPVGDGQTSLFDNDF